MNDIYICEKCGGELEKVVVKMYWAESDLFYFYHKWHKTGNRDGLCNGDSPMRFVLVVRDEQPI